MECNELKEAIEGEGWAIGDYKDFISKTKNEKVRNILDHILKEEQEHLKELLELKEVE
jgi:rubrerythrin